MSARDRAVVFAGLVVLVALAGFLALPSAGQSGPSAAPDLASPVPVLTLREGVVGAAAAIDPLVARNDADRDLVALVFSGLTRSTPDGEVVPDLAEGWTVDPDGKGYTFSIRPDATWHDGRPVTADDVVFTVLTIQDRDYRGPLHQSWATVTVVKVDNRTVRFTLLQPLGGFLQETTLPILPAHLLVDLPVAGLAGAPFNEHPVGSGPYRLVSLGAEEAIVELAAPPGAAAAPTGPAGAGGPIPRIAVRFFPDAAALADAVTAGRIDTAAGLGPEEASRLAGLSSARVVRYPSTTLTSVVLNLRAGRSIFGDVSVRRGLLQAIDREAIIAGLYHGYASRADSPISPASWAFDPAHSAVYAYNVTTAEADLKKGGWKRTEAGWVTKSGALVEIRLAVLQADVDPAASALAEQVASAWRSLGLKVEVMSEAPDALSEALVRGQFTAAILDVNMGLDPDVYPILASTQAREGGPNVSGYQSAALDKLLGAARLASDRETRKRQFAALQEALTRDVPLLPIVFADELYVVRDAVSGPAARQVASPSDRFWDVLTWRVAGGQAR